MTQLEQVNEGDDGSCALLNDLYLRITRRVFYAYLS